jgi:hypothetical protein
MHAEQGHVLVVAASHLIFLLLQPSHTRITGGKGQTNEDESRQYEMHTLEALVTVVLVDEDIILLGLALGELLWRKLKGAHLGGLWIVDVLLREDAPDGGVVRHVGNGPWAGEV